MSCRVNLGIFVVALTMHPLHTSAIVSMLLVLSGCCTKKDCEEWNQIQNVVFAGFASDIDSVAAEVFVAGSNFSVRVDSAFGPAGTAFPGDSDQLVYLTNGLSQFHDYRFTLRWSGMEEVFEVTDLVVERETCNSCFPYNPASNFFDQLRGYAVNGSPEFGPRIIIRRY